MLTTNVFDLKPQTYKSVFKTTFSQRIFRCRIISCNITCEQFRDSPTYTLESKHDRALGKSVIVT